MTMQFYTIRGKILPTCQLGRRLVVNREGHAYEVVNHTYGRKNGRQHFICFVDGVRQPISMDHDLGVFGHMQRLIDKVEENDRGRPRVPTADDRGGGRRISESDLCVRRLCKKTYLLYMFFPLFVRTVWRVVKIWGAVDSVEGTAIMKVRYPKEYRRLMSIKKLMDRL